MTIQIGLIGCGGIAGPHLDGYLKVEDVRVSAVCDVVADNAQKRAAQAGGAQIFSDIESLLTNSDVDAVDICLPHHLHKDAIVAAANAGKHILCEKPLCLTLKEAAAVKKAVSSNGVTLMCAHNQLFMPPLQLARKMINEGTLGKVYEIRTTDSFYHHNLNPSKMGWRAHREFIGGGELIDTGYHPSYMLLYLAGSKPVEVTAMLSQHRLAFMDGEDSAQVLVRFEDGVVGNIVTSWAYEPADGTERFSVVAEKGYLTSDGRDLRYKVRGQDPSVINTVKLPSVQTYHAEIADFIAHLRDGSRPLHNEDDGIHVLQVILGAYKSADEKRTIAVEEIDF